MSRVSSAVGDFARRGFDSPRTAAATWDRWRDRSGEEPPVTLADFEEAADRDRALAAVARIAELAPGLLSPHSAEQLRAQQL